MRKLFVIVFFVLLIAAIIAILKFVYISSLDNNYPVVGVGRTLRNMLGNQIKCPLNPMAQQASACNFCFGNICLGKN